MARKEKAETNGTADAYMGAEPANFKQSERLYTVRFIQNRKYELKVGREILIFHGGIINPIFPEKYQKGVPESIISHPDFAKAKSMFAITEGA
jgi:hypothetical protein